MATLRFRAELRTSGRGGGGHLVEIPEGVLDRLGGGGRIPVNATFNGIPYRGSIANMGGGYCLGVLRSIIAEAGVSVGDTLDVTVERDTTERTVEIPTDLAEALARNSGAREAWDRLSYTHRKEHAQAIQEAKRPETRARRLQATLEKLSSTDPR